MKKGLSIGAAIIVKNEAENISRCLQSISSICDQIVVVDTGSDDNTPFIVTNFGVDIYFKK